MNPNVEVEITATEQGLLIQKRTAARHPVDRVYAVLGRRGSTDDYIERIRGYYGTYFPELTLSESRD